MMEYLSSNIIAVIFIVLSISSKATFSFPTNYSTLDTRTTDALLSTSSKSVVFGAETTTDELDWQRGGIGGLADRSQEQLAGPPMETQDHIRAKRKGRGRELIPNKYNDGPDLILGPSPSPGIGLDSRIHLSDDGQYHGNSRKYLGPAADLMASTPFTSHFSEIMSNVSEDDLKMVQSRFNRWRLDHFSVTRPPITTPAIARFRDVNLNPVIDLSTPGSRRMLGSGNQQTISYQTPPMLQLDPWLLIPPNQVVEPFMYNPIAFGLQTSQIPPITRSFDSLSPLEKFKRLYLNTTKRRIRTRKPRPKKPMKPIQPMKDDEYIPEENEEDITTNLIQMLNRPNINEADEKRLIPNFPSYISDDESANTNRSILNVIEKEEPFENKPKSSYSDEPDIPETEYESKDMETKQFADHEKSVVSAAKEEEKGPAKTNKNKIAVLNDSEYDMTYVKDINKYKKPLPDPEIGENIGKINIDQAPLELELSEDEEFPLSVHKKPINKKPELKELERDLLKIPVKAPGDKLVKPVFKNKDFIDLPRLKEDGSLGNSSEPAFKELMAVPLLELKTGKDDEEMNEQLKTLLMPEDAMYDPLKKSHNEDYVEIKPEEIKGLPIRRKRRDRNKLFDYAVSAIKKVQNLIK